MRMGWVLSTYFRFWWRSTNQHGVHSPFVFRWLTQGLYPKPDAQSWAAWKKYRAHWTLQRQRVTLTDLGQGSHWRASDQSTPARVAKHSGTNVRKARFLLRLSAYFQPQSILELGTSLGLGTYALHLGQPQAHICTIEGDPTLHQLTAQVLGPLMGSALDMRQQSFSQAIADLKGRPPFDLIFIDGHHQGAALLDYVQQLRPLAHTDTVWVLDDVYWSADMWDAWQQLCAWPEVSVSVDHYHLGLLFFRQGQAKEHFVLRS